ncbi:glycoside hydrolase family 26 protein [Streptomyces sp. NPDC017936]|uniref:glycoside hydrolase family 26 protein n=1 Tax=Streptomyces sp. NPDC017936 TaxID=3365016 RepID=UPI00379DD419
MRQPLRFLLLALVGLTLLTGVACLPRADGSRADGAGGAAPPPGVPPAFGAYLGHDSDAVRQLAGLDGWVGPATPRVGRAFLPGDRWSRIEGEPGHLDHWAAWRRARADRMFVLNVPMLDRNEAHLPDAYVRAELARGASGEHDGHFRTLGRRLVALGLADTVLVLGWEMNGITYTHRCGPDPVAWKRYWTRIVRTMRAVPGQRFRFDFAPNRGRDAIHWTACYPGDRYVDVIGMDAYDQPEGMPFAEQVREPYGLAAHVRFAREHKKPVSYPEWGLFRNGDNPEYVRGMLTWFARHRPLYQTISDYCPHGVWQCPWNPRSASVYRSLVARPSG